MTLPFFDNPIFRDLSREPRNFEFQFLSHLILSHLGPKSERDRSGDGLGLIGLGVDDRPAEVSVPLLSADRHPSLLVRFTHRFLKFLCGRKKRAIPILPAFPA